MNHRFQIRDGNRQVFAETGWTHDAKQIVVALARTTPTRFSILDTVTGKVLERDEIIESMTRKPA